MHRFLPLFATTLLLWISGDAELIRMNASHAHTIVCGWRAKATVQQIVDAGKFSKLKPRELDKLLVTYTNTTAMERLRQGYVGETRHTAAGSFFYSGAMEAAAAVLRLCTEEGGLVSSYRSRGSWAVPGVRTLPECGSKKLHLVVVTGEHIKPGATATERMWGSFRARGVPLPAHMLKKGHGVSWFSEKEHRGLFEGCTDADNGSYVLPFPHPQEAAKRGVQVVGLVVKERGASIMQCLQKYGIPVVLDLIDSTVYKLPSFMDYSLILATNRLSAEIMTANTGVRSEVVYHQPANYERLHRADRRRPVKVIAMTHGAESHALETDELAAGLDAYCRDKSLKFRLRPYAGHGYDQEEMARLLLAKHDWGHQIGYAMGYSSVDIGIVWRPCRVLELTCIKPTNRVAEFLSLGIPVVFQATAAYADIVVEWGYPLVANNVTHALQLVDMLVQDADLRQSASELGLRIAERFHQDVIAEEFERAMCSVVP